MLTFQKYNAIRILLESKETIENIVAAFGVKEETVKLVKRCDTYEQYKSEFNTVKFIGKQKRKEMLQKQGDSSGMNISQIKIEATHYMMEELQKMNKTLVLISNKIAFIVDELVGTKKE